MTSMGNITATLFIFFSAASFLAFSLDRALAGPKAQTSCWKRDDGAVLFDAGKIERIGNANNWEKDSYGMPPYKTIKAGPFGKDGNGSCLIELISNSEFRKLFVKDRYATHGSYKANGGACDMVAIRDTRDVYGGNFRKKGTISMMVGKNASEGTVSEFRCCDFPIKNFRYVDACRLP